MKLLFLLGLLYSCAWGQNAAGGKYSRGGSSSLGGGASGGSAPTFVQACNAPPPGGGGVTSGTCTFGGAIGAGHYLHFCVFYLSSSTVTRVGDSGTVTPDPGSSAAITDLAWETADPFHATCYYIQSATGGGTTETATALTSGGYIGMVGIELSSAAFDRADNGSAPNTSSAVPPIASLSITAANPNTMLIGVCVYAAVSTLSAGTNVAWTAPSNSIWVPNNYSGMIEYFSQAVATPTRAECGSSATGYYWWGHIIAVH